MGLTLSNRFWWGLAADWMLPPVNIQDVAAATNPGAGGYFIFAADNSTLFWGQDGGSIAYSVAVATLQGVQTLAHSDFHVV